MKLAIMQPYFIPYIGYFQLIAAVDKYVVYDDVNYIKGGWINRNNILVQNQKYLTTVPLQDASSFRKINDIALCPKLYDKWKAKFLRTVEQSYKKAPFFGETWSLITEILGKNHSTIAELNYAFLRSICSHLGLQTEIIPSSEKYNNNNLHAAERVLDICSQEKATVYINAIGGQSLYDKEHFKQHGVELYFIKGGLDSYAQFNGDFQAGLSILDVLMFAPVADIQRMLNNYELI